MYFGASLWIVLNIINAFCVWRRLDRFSHLSLFKRRLELLAFECQNVETLRSFLLLLLLLLTVCFYDQGNVEHWLDELGLGEYWLKFESSGYTDPSDLEDLKNMSKDSLKETFNMHKPGHLNKLISAIRKLQYPNQGK